MIKTMIFFMTVLVSIDSFASVISIGAYCSSLPAVSCEVLNVEHTSHQDTFGYLYTIVTYCKNRVVKTTHKHTAWNCANTGWCTSYSGIPTTNWVKPITITCSNLP